MANKPNLLSIPGVNSNGTSIGIINAAIYPRGGVHSIPRLWPIPCINGYDQHVNVINAASIDRDFVPEPYYSISVISYEVWGTFEFGPGYIGQHYLAEWYLENLPQPVIYTLESGVLPPGLTLINVGEDLVPPAYTAQGQIQGTPTAMGSFDFELRATSPAVSATKLFTINIGEGGDQTSYLYGN